MSFIKKIGREINRGASTVANVATLGVYDAIRAPDRQAREASKQANQARREADAMAEQQNRQRFSLLRAALRDSDMGSLFNVLGRGQDRIMAEAGGGGTPERSTAPVPGVNEKNSGFGSVFSQISGGSKQSGFGAMFSQISRNQGAR